ITIDHQDNVGLECDGHSTGRRAAAVTSKFFNPTKLHQCPYCAYNTKKTTNLITHLRTHTGEKPFPCTYCAYCATTRESLKRHIRTHTGEKPYMCLHCPYRSAEKGNLNSHIWTHHS
ncbi:hypothetical protein OTU49_011580, partial [Cherax quadricarinatus]